MNPILQLPPGSHSDPSESRPCRLVRNKKLGVGTLLLGHTLDDGFADLQPFLYRAHLRGIDLSSHTGDHFGNAGHTPHLAYELTLVDKVVKVKCRLHHFLLHLCSISIRNLHCSFLHQTNYVAHTKDTRCHSIGVKWFEISRLLASADKLDGLTTDTSHTHGSTTTRVTIHLGQDSARNSHCRVKRSSQRCRLLARHGINDQKSLIGIDLVLDAAELIHQILIDDLATGRIDEDGIIALGLGLLNCGRSNVHRICIGAHRKHIDANALSQYL